MKKCILSILFAIPSGLCWAAEGNLAASNGGRFAFVDRPENCFEPMLFDASWGHCRAFGGWNDENGGADGPWARTFRIVGKDESPVVRGKVTYDPDRRQRRVACCAWKGDV